MIIIATEGTVTEVEYFTQLNDAAILSSNKFQIKVIPPVNDRSSPNHVLGLLTDFKKKYQIKGEDELWMVIDRDKWEIKMLSEIQSKCKQKGIGLCISNPCFEIWLILHYKDLTKESAGIKADLRNNLKRGNNTYVKRYLSDLMGNENLNEFGSLFPLITTAMENTQLLREIPESNIFDNLGSDVDLIFEGKL
jgi:hypothetical protein